MLKKVILISIDIYCYKERYDTCFAYNDLNKFDHFLAEHKIIYIEEYQHQRPHKANLIM